MVSSSRPSRCTTSTRQRTSKKENLILFCRLTKCYKKEVTKLSISFSTGEAGGKMKTLFLAAMEALDVEQRFGKAPASHQERELQSYVESMVNA